MTEVPLPDLQDKKAAPSAATTMIHLGSYRRS